MTRAKPPKWKPATPTTDDYGNLWVAEDQYKTRFYGLTQAAAEELRYNYHHPKRTES